MSLLLYPCSDCGIFHSKTNPDSSDPDGRWAARTDRQYCQPRGNWVASEEMDQYLLSFSAVRELVNHRWIYTQYVLAEDTRQGRASSHDNLESYLCDINGEWGQVRAGDTQQSIFIGLTDHEIQHRWSTAPDFTNAVWCTTSGALYFGEYYPCTNRSGPARYGYVSNSARRVPGSVGYSCAHCAFVAAKAYADSKNAAMSAGETRYRPWVHTHVKHQPFPEYFSGTIEVVGDAFETTATIKDVVERIANSCGNCGRVGHRSNGCEKPRKAFDRVGVEIEGRFLNLAAKKRLAEDIADGEGYCDGSVASSPDSSASAWEFQSKPDSIRGACQQLVELYPDETDASCGMHVHVSFGCAADFTLLNSPSFFKYFKERWEQWGARMNIDPSSQFFRRLRGENNYCRPAGEASYRISQQDRYSQLNFTSYSEHSTVECRLLPMFVRASLGVAAIQELLDIYETFLHSPEEFGHPGFTGKASFEPTTVTPVTLKSEPLELPETYQKLSTMEMELVDLPPVADGHVRIAMAINQPVTIEALVEAMKQRAA